MIVFDYFESILIQKIFNPIGSCINKFKKSLRQRFPIEIRDWCESCGFCIADEQINPANFRKPSNSKVCMDCGRLMQNFAERKETQNVKSLLKM